MYALSPNVNNFTAGSIAAKDRAKTPVNQIKPLAKTDPNSDESLLIAVGNTQDTSAFNQLFIRFSKKIFAMGMKLTRNEQVAHDLVQEAMLTVWQKAPLYDLDRGTAQSWIFTLTRNRCFDMLRKQKRQPNTISADDIWPTEGDGDAVFVNEERGSLEVEIAQIERFYSDLPDAQQAVVKQIFVLDRTHEEAAKALQIPLGTLKSRLRLGVGKLRQLIGPTP
jgi:RNA polymerase sigma-70 factor (ECF subfamily)|tara:strand:- start:14780 stop:15445 length:666 start_codon:yes stop_codon:yes gene_type:complete